MPFRPSFTSDETWSRFTDLEANDILEQGIASLKLPTMLEDGIANLREMASSFELPSVAPQRRPVLPMVATPLPEIRPTRPPDYTQEFAEAGLDPRGEPFGAPRPSIPGPDQSPQGTPIRSPGEMAAPAQTGDLRAYTRQKAASLGIDPDIAERVAMSEGGFGDPVRQSDVIAPSGQRETSYGPFQLYVGGGLGDEAIRRGHDPRDPKNVYRNIDFALEHAAQQGWGAFHGAARVGVGPRQGIGAVAPGPAPAAPATASRAPAAMPERASQATRPTTLQGITPPQFGLGDADAEAICGPVLAMAFARANGRNPTIAEAKQMAQQYGGWTNAQGMGGPEAMANTLRQMGIPATYHPGALDVETIRRETANGNPVGINTRGHYFVVEAVDEQGRFDLGNSAKALRASGGRQWFHPSEIASLGMGAPTGAIYKDAPSSPAPSVAVRETRMPPVNQAPAAPAPTAESALPPGIPPIPANRIDPVWVKGKYDSHWEERSYVERNPGDYQVVYDPKAGAADMSRLSLNPGETPGVPSLEPAGGSLPPPAGSSPLDDARSASYADQPLMQRNSLDPSAEAQADTYAPPPPVVPQGMMSPDPTDIRELTQPQVTITQGGPPNGPSVPLYSEEIPGPDLSPQGTPIVSRPMAPSWTYDESPSAGLPGQGQVPPPSPYQPEQEASMVPAPTRMDAPPQQPFKPVWDAAGNAIGYVQESVAPAAEGIKRAATGLYEAVKEPENVTETVGSAATRAGQTAVQAINQPTAPTDPFQWGMTVGAPAQARAVQIVTATTDAFGDEVGRRVGRAMGLTDDELFSIAGIPVSGEDIAGFAGSMVGDPTNFVPGVPAVRQGLGAAARGMGRAVRPSVRAAVEAAQTGASAVGRTVGRVADDLATPAVADDGVQMLGSGVVPQAAPQHVYSPTAPPGAVRRFHGTAGAFDAADPARFDDNGLFGPGYYTTSDPRVASSYAGERQVDVSALERLIADQRDRLTKPWNQSPETQDALRQDIARLRDELASVTRSGPNVRAVDVPSDLNMLDADAPVSEAVLSRISRIASALRDRTPALANELDDAILRIGDDIDRRVAGSGLPPLANVALYDELADAADRGLRASGESGTGRGFLNEILERAGFDGIVHKGGHMTPLLDDAGKPIEHDVSVVFPGSVEKVRNAFSGTQGGSGLVPARSTLFNAAQGGALGAISEDLQAAQEGREADPQERMRRLLTGAALGVGAGRAVRRGAGQALGSGMVPESGGGSVIEALGKAFPRAAVAYRSAAARNASRMAAEGIEPASKVDLVRGTVGTVGYGSMLGPGTAAFNMAASMTQPIWALPKEPTRAIVRAIGTRNPEALREPAAALTGAMTGFGHVGEALWDVIRARGRYAPPADNPALSQRIADPIGRGLMQALETPGRVWAGAPDAIFGTLAQYAVEARRAAQLATDAGHRGQKWTEWFNLYMKEAERVRTTGAPPHQIGAGTAEILRAGEEAAERAAYRQPLGKIGQMARKVARLGDAPLLGNFSAPFFNSPWNIHLQALERTPVGLVMNTQPSRFDKYYDAAVGTAAVLGMVEIARNGVVTINGSGPTNANERQAWLDQGNRPYSLMINGVAVPTRTFAHAEGLLNAVGETMDFYRYQKPEADERVTSTEALTRIGRLIKQYPYAAGYATIADLVNFGPAAALADLGARFTPGGATLRTVGMATDPSERTTDRGAGVPILEEARQRWQLATGQRENLPVAQNILGEPKENEQQGIAAFFGRLGYAKNHPIISRFQEARVSPGDPPRELTDLGVQVKLTPDETRRWDTLRGQEIIRQTERITDDTWARTPPEWRVKLLEQIKTDASAIATARLKGEMGTDWNRRLREAAGSR